MAEKEVLIIIKSKPFTNLNYYEGLRTAAGFWDHQVKILWMGEGVYGAINQADKSLTGKFLSDLPDLDIELYVDKEALVKAGFTEEDLVEETQLADMETVQSIIEGTEASFVF
ncbi:MAG: DsrE family protein [Candidatus Bathyarchaeota archaeon]|nr:DsrE family protein [Candidatus Bathyarchaeota archaeon]